MLRSMKTNNKMLFKGTKFWVCYIALNNRRQSGRIYFLPLLKMLRAGANLPELLMAKFRTLEQQNDSMYYNSSNKITIHESKLM